MKKNIARILTPAMAAALVLTLAACGAPSDTSKSQIPGSGSGGTTPPPVTGFDSSVAGNDASGKRDWTGFDAWSAENWTAKTPAYQFTGHWDMGDDTYGFAFDYLLNLYTDGSVQVNQYAADRGDYYYYGYWSEENTVDGNEIALEILKETPLEGTELIDHRYSYTLYEEADGGYSFGFDFGMIPGQYFRVADVKGSSSVVYDSFDAFHAAADAARPGETAGNSDDAGDAEDAGDEPSASYPAHTMVLPFTPDSSEQLKTEFYCDAVSWGTALGASGAYEPTGAEDVILSWTSDGSPNYHLEFKADGTYEYQFTTVNISETGTWSFTGWTLTVTTANGSTFTGSITQ